MTPEAKAKATIKKLLTSYGAYYAMPIGTMFGKAGIPDFLGCHKGRFFGIEVKANTDLSQLQKHNLALIVAAGGKAFVYRQPTKGEAEGLPAIIAFLEGN